MRRDCHEGTDMTICYARRLGGDQMRCNVCSLTWDIDDQNPPLCGKLTRVASPPLQPTPPERVPFASGLPFRDR